MKICDNCGCVNDSINRYCRNCGTRFVELNEDNSITPEEKTDGVTEPSLSFNSVLSQGDEYEKDDEEQYEITEGIPVPFIDFDFGDTEKPTESAAEILPELNEKLYSTHPVINVLKKSGASKRFLFTCIFSVLFSAFLSYYAFNNNISYSFPELLSGIIKVSVLPSWLYAIGLWIFFASCSDRRKNYAYTGGLSLVKTASILGIIFSALSEYTVMMMSFLYLHINNFYQGIVCFFVGSSVITIAIIYFAISLSCVGKLKKCASNGKPVKLSLFSVLINYIIILCLGPLIGYFVAKRDTIALCVTVFLMITLTLFASSIQLLRSYMKEI